MELARLIQSRSSRWPSHFLLPRLAQVTFPPAVLPESTLWWQFVTSRSESWLVDSGSRIRVAPTEADPGFTRVDVVTLALGFGVNAAFSPWFRRRIFAPLPYREIRQLMMV